jgi:hypothetical protein
MARKIVNLERLAEAQEALQAAVDAMAEALAVVAVDATGEPMKLTGDGKMTTSIRIHPDKLFALKTLAHHRRVRVNALIDAAIDHYLELRTAIRKRPLDATP